MSIELRSRQNLFRYVSEWNPRAHAHTKGGYLEGRILVPDYAGHMRMRLETLAGNEVKEIRDVSPLILHVVRMGKGRRLQEKEPVPTHLHWKQDFLIEKEKLFILNQTSELDVLEDGRPRDIPAKDHVNTLTNRSITLGGSSGDLNLVVLLPKQDARAKEGEATVRKVLADRLPDHSQKAILELSKFFTGKHAQNIKSVRLKASFYAVVPGQPDQLLAEIVSQDRIIDIGSKDIGALQLHDVTPLKSCSRGGRKIVAISEYDLAAQTMPVFQLFSREGVRVEAEEHLLVQPMDRDRGSNRTISVRKTCLIFITPDQPKLNQIYELGLEIWLAVKRTGDGQVSNNRFRFRYVEHKQAGCLFCQGRPDIEEEKASIQEQLERPKPRQKKRHMDKIEENGKKRRQSFSSDSEPGSPMSVGSSGYLSSTPGRTELLSPERWGAEEDNPFPSEQGSVITLTAMDLLNHELPTEYMKGWQKQSRWSAEVIPDDLSCLSSEEDFLEVEDLLAQTFEPRLPLNFEDVFCQGVISVDANRRRQSPTAAPVKRALSTPPPSPPTLTECITAEIPFLSWIFIIAVLAFRLFVPAILERWSDASVIGGGKESDFAATGAAFHTPVIVITSSLITAMSLTAGRIILKRETTAENFRSSD